ncbi:unnamed protein product [Pieris brassicae]|uniref:Aminopeptidase n=1 Tax=Pieris brassicae TaxID=7116 RepID=A0A9P0TZ21_PIEBR|nr:unnamed protein product [Pieris brassicae]
MAPHWYCLFLGVMLTQGLLALSPIPVPEEEWIEFSRMLRDPQYRLPRTSVPQKYQVTLTPYLDIASTPTVSPFTFDGAVTIELTVLEATNEIVLHCNDLIIHELTLTTATGVAVGLESNTFVCEMPYSFLRVRASSQLSANTQYILKSRFSGNLQTNMRGFYRSWYKDSNGQKRWLGSTQFQPGHARQAFPCYDEPSFKALFDITIIRDSTLQPTVSNMPIKVTTNVSGRISETFHTTPKTSTYLLGFIVSDFEIVATNKNVTHPFYIYARTTANETGNFALEMGIKLLDIMTEYTKIPYYDMAPNIDMKQAAIPDFSAGAMENWGMLTYREAFLLYDEDNSNHWYKQRIANVIGHEVAHQWFGNLVTCSWWDNLWLNEAFGRFYQYYLAEMGAPEMGFNTRFIVEQLRVSMLSDSVDSAHALTNPDVNDPASVSAHFSTITYARGASMLRMTQYLLGDETFVKGLRKFLEARKFDVADPNHLFSALDEAAREDGALANYDGVTVESYFRTWSERAGHPLLTVTVNQTSGQVRINQARWERDTGKSQYSQIWQIPVTWTRANASDFDDLKPSLMITEAAASFDRGSTGPEWILLNKQQTSFYRVNYDHNNWILLTRALRSNSRTAIHEFNRAQLVDDLFNFARAGLHTYNTVFNILSFLEFEDQYTPWISAITGFNFARSRLAYDSANLQKLDNLILSLSKAIVARLGYVEKPGEPFLDGLLRTSVMNFLCNIGDEQCLSTAKTTFEQWRNGGRIYPNMRPWVYCNGLRQGTAEDFTFFWNKYLNEQLATEVVVMLTAAGCTKDTTGLETFLSAIINAEEIIRPQDVSTALSSAVTSNEENTMKVFNWLKRNLVQVNSALGSASTFISNIGGRLRNEAQITEFQNWLDENRVTLGAAYTTGVNSIASTRSNMAWSAKRLSEFTTYFDKGYVEEELDLDEAEEGEEGDPEEDTGDDASIAALSTVLLLITVSINMYV